MGCFSSAIALHWKRMLSRKESRVAFLMLWLIMGAAFVEGCISVYGADKSTLLSPAAGWIGHQISVGNIMPPFYYALIYVIPAMIYADSAYEDRLLDTMPLLQVRGSQRNYIFSGALTAFTGGFLAVLLPLLLFQLLAFIVFPMDGIYGIRGVSALTDNIGMYFYLFQDLAENAPYLNNVIFMLYPSLWVGIMCIFSYALSFFVKKGRLIVVALPTIAMIVIDTLIGLITDSNFCDNSIYLFVDFNVPSKTVYYWAIAPLAVLALGLSMLLPQMRRRDVLS